VRVDPSNGFESAFSWVERDSLDLHWRVSQGTDVNRRHVTQIYGSKGCRDPDPSMDCRGGEGRKCGEWKATDSKREGRCGNNGVEIQYGCVLRQKGDGIWRKLGVSKDD